jgi:hypothetical protein
MIPKPIDDLAFADIANLVASEIREGRSLDFKRDGVGSRDEDKREFLADLTAMANAYGGDLVFGVDEKRGIAVACPGIELVDPEAEVLRLHQILQGGVEPRLSRVEIHWLPKGGGNRGALIVRVPQSFSAPHRVIFRDHAKFYSRNSSGKYAMDTLQLRAAFGASESVPERLRAFHEAQISAALADQLVFPLHLGPLAITHFAPLSAFTAPIELSLGPRDGIPPPFTSGWSSIPTLEGVATYSGPEENALSGVRAFTLLHRTGVVEFAAVIPARAGNNFVHPATLEETLRGSAEAACRAATKHDVDGPFMLAFSLTRMFGVSLSVPTYHTQPKASRRTTMTFPSILVDDADVASLHLAPLNELLWNAFGLYRPADFRPQ